MQPICRVCLKPTLEYIDLETPFSTGNCEEIEEEATFCRNSISGDRTDKKCTYLDCFLECTRLDAEEEDSYDDVSKRLCFCVPCGLELRIAYEFIKKAESAAIILEQSRHKNKLERLENLRTYESDEDGSSKFREYEELLDAVLCSESVELDVPSITKEEVNYTDLHTSEIQEANEVSSEQYESRDIIYVDIASGDHVMDVQIDQRTEEAELHKVDESCNDRTESNEIRRSSFVENTDQDDSFQSATSDDRFSTKYSLRRHHRAKRRKTGLIDIENEHNSNVTRCSQCDFENKDFKVREHEQLFHPKKQDFLCNICSKTFTSFGILNAHLKYHQRKEANIKSDACTICGKQFSTKNYLRLHMEVHKNNRDLHECGQCDKLYVTRTALENHQKLHKGETIKCVSCEKEFSRQYELNVHMRFHTRDFPFECDICGKKFAIKGHLRTHMWRHQGLKLQCEDCGKLFTSSKALQEHSFIHSAMPFPCSYCPKKYPSKQKFKVHLKVAHSLELNNDELQKITRNTPRKPIQRKKPTLVQADSVMKEVEVKTRDSECDDVE